MSDTPVKKIVHASVGPFPMSFNDFVANGMRLPEVNVVYEDGSREMLFSFYPDEIMFHDSEFIGLTREQAMTARHKKDVAYIRS